MGKTTITKRFNKKTFTLLGHVNRKSDAKEHLKRISDWAYGRIVQGKDGIYQVWCREKKKR